MNDRYLTIKEVAEILSVTPLTLRNWDRKGLLTAFRNPINNYRLYRHSDVAELVNAIQKTGSREPPPIQKLPVRFEEDEPNPEV